MSSTDTNSLYVRRQGRISGPYDWRTLQTMAKRGTLSRFHEVSVDGEQWVPAAEHPSLFDAHFPSRQPQPTTLNRHQMATGITKLTRNPLVRSRSKRCKG
jgi:hypothetical protein